MAENQDEKTAIQPPPQVQSVDEDLGNALPNGTRLGEFEITGLIGEGGFGIVYFAYDHSLQRTVALKEYMPSSLAARGQGMSVSVRSQRHAETFSAGLRSFINEARLLAQFDHPSLVKVYRFWEANGTAYMVMPYYEGMTLKQALKRSADPPHEDWLKGLLAQLADALELIHGEQCFHRDIAPDNIILLKDGRPLLLDFGAARRVIGDMTQALTVILKPGYAPLEQYAEVPHMKQGAWTDIYALAAVVYFAITGKPPTPSVGRMMNDTLVPLAQAGAGRYSAAFLQGIDRALAVRPEDRPQNMAELRKLLGLQSAERTLTLSAVPVAAPAAGAKATGKAARPAPAAGTGANARSSKAPLLIGLLAVLAAAGGGAYYLLGQKSGPKPAAPIPAPAPASAPIAAPTPAPAPGAPPEKTAEAPPAAATPAPAATEETKPPQEPPAAASAKPFDPVDTLDRVYALRDPEHAVSVVLDRGKVRIGKDRLRFRISSSRPGFLYLLMVGTDRKHFNLLFPNDLDKNNRVAAEKDLALPRPGWAMVAGGPPGINHFVAVVSEHPRSFTEAGLVQVPPFAEFPLEQAQKVALAAPENEAPFAGKAQCKDDAPCSAAYGAATFTIEEVEGGASADAAPAARQRARAARRADAAGDGGGGEDPAPPPEDRPRAKAHAKAAPLNLPSIPGGGRLAPEVEKLLNPQSGMATARPAAPNPQDDPPGLPRAFIPGAGNLPRY